MKYAIYGAGSLGLVASAILKKNNEEFDLVDRNIKSVNAIKENGIKIVGTLNLIQKVNVILDTNCNEKYDIIFMFTKQIDNLNTINKLKGLLKEDGVICTMQNGLPELDLASVIGEKRAYGAAVGFGATRLDYGVSELTSENTKESMTFSVGNLSGYHDEHFEEIKRILSIIGNVTAEENFIGARYVKLLINSAFSGMSTVCGATFGEVSKNKKSRRIIQSIIKECIEVAKASKIKIEPIQGKDVVKLLDYNGKLKKWLSFMIIPLAIKKHALLKASMLQDIQKGLPCEIDSINKVISDMGKKCNVATPYNDKVVEIVKKMEAKQLKPDFNNVLLFSDIK